MFFGLYFCCMNYIMKFVNRHMWERKCSDLFQGLILCKLLGIDLIYVLISRQKRYWSFFSHTLIPCQTLVQSVSLITGCNYIILMLWRWTDFPQKRIVKAVAKTENTGLFIQSEENTAVLFEFNSPLFSVLKYNWLLKFVSSDCVIFLSVFEADRMSRCDMSYFSH